MAPLKRMLLSFFIVFSSVVSAENDEVKVYLPDILVTSVNVELDKEVSDQLQIKINNELQEISYDKNRAVLYASFQDKDILQVFVSGKEVYAKPIRAIPLWFSILPPLIAIMMALVTKEVFSSLFVGLLVGTTIIFKYKGFSVFVSVFKGLFAVVDTYALASLNNPDHLSIIIFSMLIGGMVALITLNGGMKGVVSFLAKYAKSPRSGQFITWLMGMIIFFDDYANTLVVGNTMRPVTDKLHISREKLAYIVDSTSAPIASIAFITTWIGAELSYISEGINHLGINKSAYQVFLNSLTYSFYPILTLGFVLMLI